MSEDIESKLMKKAKLIMELREYDVEDVQRDEGLVNIRSFTPKSGKKVLMRIVTKSDLASNAVGVELSRSVLGTIEEEGYDQAIVLANRFTSAARKMLTDEGVEFYSKRQKILSSLDPQGLYSKIIDCVDDLCRIRCGKVPQSEDECKGYSRTPLPCSLCDGSGEVHGSTCPLCDGRGSGETHYSCTVRLISDNADFHYQQDWLILLQSDLRSLLELLLKADSSLHESLTSQ